MTKLLKYALAAWGFYYLLTGLWATLHLSSFLTVVSYKADPFKTQINAVLFMALGAVYIYGALSEKSQTFVAKVAGSTALAVSIVTFAWLAEIGRPLSFQIESFVELLVGSILLALAFIARRPSTE